MKMHTSYNLAVLKYIIYIYILVYISICIEPLLVITKKKKPENNTIAVNSRMDNKLWNIYTFKYLDSEMNHSNVMIRGKEK